MKEKLIDLFAFYFFFLNLMFITTIWGRQNNTTPKSDCIVKHVRLKEINSVGGDYIYGAFGLCCLHDGSLLVTDKLDYRIKKIDVEGNLIKEVGKKGKGYGEFSGPSAIAVGNQCIAVADFQSPRVQLFSFDLEYLKEFYAPGPIINLAYDGNGELWIGILTYTKSMSLLKVDENGSVMKGIQLKNITKDPFENLFNFTILKEGTIAVVFACQNIVEKWGTDGQYYEQKRIPGFPDKPARVQLHKGKDSFNNGSDHLVPNGSLFFKISSDTSNNIYILGEDYSIVPQRDVFILDQNGNLTGMMEIPQESAWIYIDSYNNLWSIESHRTQIYKYRILK
jgi:hypothetical protein